MINYFSLWIANFGVDPLFSIMFFLLFPAFFLLNLLLHLVCIVFDPIILPLPLLKSLNCKFRSLFLSIYKSNVKVFLACYAILTYSNILYASNIKEIFISVGEQVEISLPNINKYSVGNKDVIKHKFRPKYHQILIKGKKIGFSDIVIWQNHQKQTYHIYVISKKEQLEKITLIESLKKLNLKIRTQGNIVYVYGTIKKQEQFVLLNKIKEKKHKNLILNIDVHKELRNALFSKVYLSLFADGAKKVICQNFGIKIQCAVQGISLEASSINYFKENFFIIFTNQFQRLEDKNFHASFKIVQVETSKAEYLKLGLSSISAQVKDLMFSENILKQESIKIGNSIAKIKVLAEPQMGLILNDKAKIQLGAEVPFTKNSNNNQANIAWKFYGLKINALLKSKYGKPLIQYETELTSPSKKSIAGTKGKSSIYLEKDKYIKLFEIDYHIDANSNSYLPLLGEVPILKILFSSQQNVVSYKHIICFIKLEEK